MNDASLHPDSLLVSLFHEAAAHQGAIKVPIYQSSTFSFPNAEAMKRIFAIKNGYIPFEANEKEPMVYGRWNHPGLQALEARLCVWDGGEGALAFESGMAAISSCWLALLRPGDVILYSNPLYGGSDAFIHNQLAAMQIGCEPFDANETAEEILGRLQQKGIAAKVRLIHVETPCNPHNLMIDLEVVKNLKKSLSTTQKEVIVTVDNTYYGPVFQQPIKHGADLVLYSATKYIGGHSDVMAGACIGRNDLINTIRSWRTQLGGTASPFTCFLLLRSLETLSLRMEKAAQNARLLADWLHTHPKVNKVYFPELAGEQNTSNNQIFRKQCEAAGAMIAFDIRGDEAAAFRFLDALKLIRLAVSLGGTESLCTHPATTSHAPLSAADRAKYGIGEAMIRFSVGIEHAADLQNDLEQALKQV